MLEIGIFCVIFLAASYWSFLWFMGRREDVLHGEFVEGDALPEEPAWPIPAAPPAFRPERLQSLLHSIQRDLDQMVPK